MIISLFKTFSHFFCFGWNLSFYKNQSININVVWISRIIFSSILTHIMLFMSFFLFFCASIGIFILKPFILPFYKMYKMYKSIENEFCLNSNNIYKKIFLLENKIFTLYSFRFSRFYFIIDVEGIKINMTTLISNPNYNLINASQKKIGILIHGLAGSSINIMPSVFSSIGNDIEIHALDLPLFGRSFCDKKEDNQMILSFSPTNILMFYKKCILSYIDQIILSKYHKNEIDITIFGHSFGAFIATYLADESSYIDRIILLNPAGLFPILGRNGNFWSSFFNLGGPFPFMKLLNFLDVLFPLFYFDKIDINSLITMHHYFTMALPFSFGNEIVKKFTYQGLFWASWKYPLLYRLLQSKIKMGIIYGKNDTMIPISQIEHISKLWNDIAFDIVDNSGHIPHFDNPECFSKSLKKVWKNASTPSESVCQIGKKIEEKIKMSNENEIFCSSFSPKINDILIQLQYNHLFHNP